MTHFSHVTTVGLIRGLCRHHWKKKSPTLSEEFLLYVTSASSCIDLNPWGGMELLGNTPRMASFNPPSQKSLELLNSLSMTTMKLRVDKSCWVAGSPTFSQSNQSKIPSKHVIYSIHNYGPLTQSSNMDSNSICSRANDSLVSDTIWRPQAGNAFERLKFSNYRLKLSLFCYPDLFRFDSI